MYNGIKCSSLGWDYNQEQKEKYANMVRQLAQEINTESDGSLIPSILNDYFCYLSMLGYPNEVIQTQRDSLEHFDHIRGKDAIVKCMNRFADSILSSDMPKHKNLSPEVNINTSNNNIVNNTLSIKIIEEILSQELTSDQIEELSSLIKTKKGGDLKKWFSDLGNGTLSGILSAIAMKLPDLFI